MFLMGHLGKWAYNQVPFLGPFEDIRTMSLSSFVGTVRYLSDGRCSAATKKIAGPSFVSIDIDRAERNLNIPFWPVAS